jgi:shikimate dehydrogenase
MTTGRPLRVVSLPGRSVGEVRSGYDASTRAGADILEIRIDRLAPAEFGALHELFPAPLPLLATYRSRAEGGEGASEPSERAIVFERLDQLPFAYIDRELARDEVPPTPGPSVASVISTHLSVAPRPNEVREALGANPRGAAWLKLVAPASFDDLGRILREELDPPPEAPFCFHTVGPTGPLLRATAGRLGMAAVYASPPAGASPFDVVEPSQVAVDRLTLMGGEDDAPRFALLGHPVSHSLSPQTHSEWIRASHRHGLYVALDVPSASEFNAALELLPGLGFRGFNVTHPFKSDALAGADLASPAARRTRSANTVTVVGDQLRAENSDYTAVRRRLLELRSAGRWNGTDATVVGAGGAARTALVAALDSGASPSVVARRPLEEKLLHSELGVGLRAPRPARKGSLVIHATPAGRREAPVLEVDLTPLLGPGVHLLDFVYRPEHPVIREMCEGAGASYEDGERLLLYQAAESFRIWWGEPPPELPLHRAA